MFIRSVLFCCVNNKLWINHQKLNIYQQYLSIFFFRCNSLLRKGGSLILLDLLEQTFWIPDVTKPDARVPIVSVSQEWLVDSLKRNGFAIDMVLLHLNDSINHHSPPYYDPKGSILVWATKTDGEMKS